MNKKIRFISVLFILIPIFSNSTDANAGFFDSVKTTHVDPGLQWLSSQNTKWIFGNSYPSAEVIEEPANANIHEILILETQNPITPARTTPLSVKEYVITATAYSSTIDQTDDTPFITASGTYVRDGVAAANFLPFGTVFKIPDLYGDKIFIVEDRMNQRYWYRVDIWFPERQMAKEFGVKQIRIEIVS